MDGKSAAAWVWIDAFDVTTETGGTAKPPTAKTNVVLDRL
jgi:hypothetical protein